MPKETTKNEFQLMERIVEMSVADDFQKAKLEWMLVRIYKEDEGQCLCGHSPIINHCVLRNKLNGNETVVGSSCVQKFIGLPTEKLFASYTYIVKDKQSYLGMELIEYLHEHDIINDWEYEFLKSTFRKRFEWLSEKQQEKRLQINRKVIDYMNQEKKSANNPEVYARASQASKLSRGNPVTLGDDNGTYEREPEIYPDDEEDEERNLEDAYYRDLVGY